MNVSNIKRIKTFSSCFISNIALKTLKMKNNNNFILNLKVETFGSKSVDCNEPRRAINYSPPSFRFNNYVNSFNSNTNKEAININFSLLEDDIYKRKI